MLLASLWAVPSGHVAAMAFGTHMGRAIASIPLLGGARLATVVGTVVAYGIAMPLQLAVTVAP